MKSKSSNLKIRGKIKTEKAKMTYTEEVKAKLQAEVCRGLRIHDQAMDAIRIEKNGATWEELAIAAYQMGLLNI
jgi:hypothetical protein